jgi:hypothetical protein
MLDIRRTVGSGPLASAKTYSGGANHELLPTSAPVERTDPQSHGKKPTQKAAKGEDVVGVPNSLRPEVIDNLARFDPAVQRSVIALGDAHGAGKGERAYHEESGASGKKCPRRRGLLAATDLIDGYH